MDKQSFETWPRPDESPAVSGPDYVALVIEWDDLPEEEVTARIARPVSPTTRLLAAAGAIGAFAALLLARWGLRRLRHA